MASRATLTKGLKVIESERAAIAPRSVLILERPGEGRREEWTLLAGVLPDGRFDAAASQRTRGFVVGSHLVSSFVERCIGSLAGRGQPMHRSWRKRLAEGRRRRVGEE